jgi:hypothetical protein
MPIAEMSSLPVDTKAGFPGCLAIEVNMDQ